MKATSILILGLVITALVGCGKDSPLPVDASETVQAVTTDSTFRAAYGGGSSQSFLICQGFNRVTNRVVRYCCANSIAHGGALVPVACPRGINPYSY